MRGVRRSVRQGVEMGTAEKHVIQGADSAALMEEGGLKRELEGVGEVYERGRGGAERERRVRAFLARPSGVKVTDQDTGALGTSKMTEDLIGEIGVQEVVWRLGRGGASRKVSGYLRV